MITKICGYKSSDGTVHGSLELAKKADLEAFFKSADNGNDAWQIAWIADWILSHPDKVLDILTTGPRSKVRARKINGAKRAKKSTRHEAEQFKMPLEDNPKDAA